MFLRKLKGLPLTKAVNLYLEMAGLPVGVPPKCHEYPKSPEFPKSPKSPRFRKCPECPKSREYPVPPVHPVSNGQALEEELQGLAARNACTRAEDKAERKRFKLARDVRALEKRIGRELTMAELRLTCDEWECASLPFLGWDDDDHFAMLLAELTKVRVPTGEGDTFNRALENVSKLPDSDLPEIPGYGDAPKPMRKLAALHREMSRLCGNKTYFLSCRDAAKASSGLSHQTAYNINLALAWPQLGVIKIVRVGDRRPKGKASKLKASEFKYLLSQTEKGAPHAENERDASKDGEGQNAGDCPF